MTRINRLQYYWTKACQLANEDFRARAVEVNGTNKYFRTYDLLMRDYLNSQTTVRTKLRYELVNGRVRETISFRPEKEYVK
jgi:hypothetical protein